MLKAKITLACGILLCLSSALGFITAATGVLKIHTYLGLSPQGFILMSLLQIFVALFIIYASLLTIKKDDIAIKLYPSSIAAQILLIFMWQYGV